MRLMDAYNETCVLLEKTRVSDGLGGYNTTWTDGASFVAAWEYMSSPEMVLAEQQGVGRAYRIYVDKTLDLDYHDAFRRVTDSQVFRVINPGTDRHTPASSTLNKRLIEVEKWELPHSSGDSDA